MDAAAAQLFFEGTDHLAARRPAQAEACFREALRIEPSLGEAHANLAWLLAESGARREADICYRRALSFRPEHVPIHLNYGAFLAEAKRFDAAEAIYRRAIELAPTSAPAWSNLGALYAQMARFDEAERCCRHSMALDASYAGARTNLAYLCLRQGRFAEGWEHYEHRDWRLDLSAQLDGTRWTGQPLEGKSLLIAHEGGHGDMIFFARYATELKRRGAARIALLCPAPLQRLMQTLEGIDEWVASDQPLPRAHWDHWVSLASLPGLRGTRVDSIPAALPYLRAHPQDAARWQARLPQQGVRIGLVWKGNPGFENDSERSLPSLDVLTPLASVAGANFISLQKGNGESEALQPRGRLKPLPFGSELQSFADTAGLMANIDLVISVDTAVAHLAGAMGKPCWLLLPHHMADWRWLAGRSDSPWYPGTMRLFRQTARGEWGSVVAQVRRELVGFVKQTATADQQAGANVSVY